MTGAGGAEVAFDAGNIVGESAVWDDRQARLYWVDIVGKTIHGFDPATGAHETWNTPDLVTSIGLRADGGAVVGLARTVTLWDFEQEFRTLAEVEPDLPENRLNEGVVGPDGTLWVGTMQNNINTDGSPKDMTETAGRLYRVTADGAVLPLTDDRFGITNTLVWPTAQRLVTADTIENALYAYDYDTVTGQLAGRRTILQGFERGLPDGSCMDEEGYIWNCRVVGGSCLLRVDPEGRIDRVVELPCSWPTSCTFGGPEFETLYVTSARFTMTPQHLEQAPWEGALFRLDAGVRGVPANRFGQ